MDPRRVAVLVVYGILVASVVLLTCIVFFFPPPPLSLEVMKKTSFFGLDPVWPVIFMGWLVIVVCGWLFLWSSPHIGIRLGQAVAKIRGGKFILTLYECPKCRRWYLREGHCPMCPSAPELRERTETLA